MSYFSWYDGAIVAVYLVATMAAGIWVRKYVGKVEHFLVAGREMNLYLGIASLAATEFGIVTCMYTAQLGYKYGFAGAVPGIAMAIAMFVVGKTGFCINPLRNAGVVTIPELLDRQFGQRVRSMAGVVIVLGGLLNMGVFLRMGGDFLVNVCGIMPPGGAHTPTFFQAHYLEITMTVLLVGVATYTILGGMLSVLVTDYLQFVVMSIGLIAVTFLVFANVGWTKLADTVSANYHAGGFNPFANPKLGWSWVLFQTVMNTAAVLTWQTTIARVLAAKNTETGRKIYTHTSFFFVCRFLIPATWGIAALAVLEPGLISNTAKLDNTILAMPMFLGQFVPVGLMGLLVAAMLAADMSTDSSYMLTWGSVIYNDIMAPFRRKPWSDKKGLMVNRAIIACIGVFLLFFGLWYQPSRDMWSYLMITGTIYLSSLSAMLIACCYWKGANSWGAVSAIVIGAVIPIAFLVMEKVDSTKQLAEAVGPNFSGLAAFGLAALAMIFGSLLKSKLKGKVSV